MRTVSSLIVARIPRGAERRGVDAVDLCLASGIDPAELDDIDGRIDAPRYLALWSEAMRRVADAGFPFDIAADVADTPNLLRFVCSSCANLGEALERASRYVRVMTDSVAWPLTVLADRTVLTIERPREAPLDCRALDEYATAELVTLARRFTGVVEAAPLEVRFAHAEPADRRRYDDLFRAPIRFSCPQTEVHFSRRAVALPLLEANPATQQYFERIAAKAMPAETSTTELVRARLLSAFTGQVPTLDQIATTLGMSARTLRRRLDGEETTFRVVLDDARMAIAKQHLAQRTVSIAELAFLLGFSDATAFHRAFKRWTGRTPQAFARGSTSRARPEHTREL